MTGKDIYDRYEARVGESALLFGPGHIVWCDGNFEDRQIDWCLKYAVDKRRFYDTISDADMELVCESLRELRRLSIEDRERGWEQ